MLHDLILYHPQYLFAGCLAWFVVVAWVLLLVNRMIMLDVDILTGSIGIGLALGLGFMSIHPPKPILQPISIGMLYLSGCMIPVVRALYLRREKRGGDIDGVKMAYEGFVLRPNNPAAQIRLARHLYNLGVRGHAVVLAEGALPQLARQFFPEEHRMVEIWRRTPLPQSAYLPISCAECGTMNTPGTIHCMKCGARYLLDRVRGKSIARAFARRLVAAWLVAALSLIGIPLATSLSQVPALIVIVCLVLGSIGAMFMALRAGDTAS